MQIADTSPPRKPIGDPVLVITDPVAVASALLDALRAAGLGDGANKPAEATTRLTTDETMHALKISKAKLLRMRDEGAPCHYVGLSPRWDPRELEEWNDARGPKGFQAKPKVSTSDIVILKSRGAK